MRNVAKTPLSAVRLCSSVTAVIKNRAEPSGLRPRLDPFNKHLAVPLGQRANDAEAIRLDGSCSPRRSKPGEGRRLPREETRNRPLAPRQQTRCVRRGEERGPSRAARARSSEDIVPNRSPVSVDDRQVNAASSERSRRRGDLHVESTPAFSAPCVPRRRRSSGAMTGRGRQTTFAAMAASRAPFAQPTNATRSPISRRSCSRGACANRGGGRRVQPHRK